MSSPFVSRFELGPRVVRARSSGLARSVPRRQMSRSTRERAEQHETMTFAPHRTARSRAKPALRERVYRDLSSSGRGLANGQLPAARRPGATGWAAADAGGLHSRNEAHRRSCRVDAITARRHGTTARERRQRTVQHLHLVVHGNPTPLNPRKSPARFERPTRADRSDKVSLG